MSRKGYDDYKNRYQNRAAIKAFLSHMRRLIYGWLYGDKPICQLSPTIIDFEYPELFDTETPYGEIEQAMLSRGGYWARCAQTGRGLMILNQPVFETILSNMCNPTFPSRDELLDWTVERWEELGVGDKVANCSICFIMNYMEVEKC